jgi:cob(I)alamin adenosyltransferase
MTKIYTRTRDDGSTGLLGAERVQKDSLRIEAFGALGECNAALGLARSDMPEEDLDKILESLMGAI